MRSTIALLILVAFTTSQTINDIFVNTTVSILVQIPNAFTEGPLWRKDTSTLIFSDIPANLIREIDPLTKTLSIYRQASNNSNGLAFDSLGRILACEQSSKRLTRTGGNLEVLASRWNGLQFNSPNDLAIKSDGSVYFTDPPYFGNQFDMNFSGVFRVFPNLTVVTVATDFNRPNGIAFSIDERTLYIADTTRNHVRAFTVAADGTVSNNRIHIQSVPNPDGIKVDIDNNLYVTSRDGLYVYRPDGSQIGLAPSPQCPSDCYPSNVAFGDADFKGIYLTARNYVYKLQGKIPGKPTDGTLYSPTGNTVSFTRGSSDGESDSTEATSEGTITGWSWLVSILLSLWSKSG